MCSRRLLAVCVLLVSVLIAGPAPAASSECVPAAWLLAGADRFQRASNSAVIDEMARRQVVLLGEQHANADHHRWQLHTLAALHARRPDMVIGFEMFPRRVQPVLERWVAGELTVQRFLAEVGWDEVWGQPAELYLPLFQFARMHRIPMIALNVERSLTEAIAQKGWDGVPEQEREGVSRPAEPASAYLDMLFEVYREHVRMRQRDASRATRNDAGFRNFVDSQQTWDRAMAQALARHAGAPGRPGPLAVGIMGGGHVRHGHGVPWQLKALGVESVAGLLPLDAGCSGLEAGIADAVYVVPPSPSDKPPPPRLGVTLEQEGKAVRLAEVSAGSLAERTGLRAGDVVVSIAGRPVNRVSSVVEAVRRQPDGTWLPMEVRRGEETREFILRFPPQR
jgi:uncharacterized iron-regulated protein